MFVFWLIVLVVSSGAAGYFFGTTAGREEEKKFVVGVLAEYRHIDADAKLQVSRLLVKLGREYRTVYSSVVDRIDQLEIELKKAL